jgi:hypothetical protein
MNCIETHPMNILMFYLQHGPGDSTPRSFDMRSPGGLHCYASGNKGCGADRRVQLQSLRQGGRVRGTYEITHADGSHTRGSFDAKWCPPSWPPRACAHSGGAVGW